MRLLLLALLLAPTAAALDALPATLGPREGTVVVRAAGVVHVATDTPAEAALDGAFAPTPVDLAVPAGAAWRGLPGAVEVRLRRADPHQAVRVELDDGATGVVLDWPSERSVPAAPLAVWAGGLALATRARRGRR